MREFAAGPPSELAGVALLRGRSEPVVAGAPPIPLADQSLAMDAIELVRGSAPPVIEFGSRRWHARPVSGAGGGLFASPGEGGILSGDDAPPPPPPPPPSASSRRTITIADPVPPVIYLSAERGALARDVRALSDRLPSATRLRLIVQHTPEEIAATFRSMLPRAPMDVAARAPLDIFRAGPDEVIAAAQPCSQAVAAFLPGRDGASLGEVAPAAADALAACDCRMTDGDRYVALVLAALMPLPAVGAVDVSPAVLAGLPTNATVDDLATALLAAR